MSTYLYGATECVLLGWIYTLLWLYARVTLQSLKFQMLRLFRARSCLYMKAYVTIEWNSLLHHTDKYAQHSFIWLLGLNGWVFTRVGWVYTVQLNEYQGTLCWKQLWHLKVNWLLGTRTYSHLILKHRFNHLRKLARCCEYLSVWCNGICVFRVNPYFAMVVGSSPATVT